MTILLGGVLLFLLLFSATLYIFESPKQMQRRFLFVAEGSGRPAGEVRSVARGATREDEITNYLNELLLGPAMLRFADIFPSGTRLNQVNLEENTLYIDFSKELAFNLEKHSLSLVEIKNLTVDNLNSNFPRVEKVVLTINGLQPRYEIKE